jgi:hypothetical protein
MRTDLFRIIYLAATAMFGWIWFLADRIFGV